MIVHRGEVAAADDMNDDENWTGGFYELSLALGAADDRRLDQAVRSLWRAAGVQECRGGFRLARCRAERGSAARAWSAAPLDRWLADVSVAVYADVPFQHAFIGFEIDENADITTDQRYAAVLLPEPDGMDYRPATA